MPESADSVLVLQGDVDVVRADEMVAEGGTLLRAMPSGGTFAVDMSDVEFIDSSGLSGLLQLRRAAEQRGIEVRLRRVPEHVATLLRLSGLEQVLPSD